MPGSCGDAVRWHKRSQRTNRGSTPHWFFAARQFLERSLAICEKVLGSEHPDTAATLNNLAFLLRAQGRPCGSAATLSARAGDQREGARVRTPPNRNDPKQSCETRLQEALMRAAARSAAVRLSEFPWRGAGRCEAVSPTGASRLDTSRRLTPWLGISDTNFDEPRENSSL
jgi:hypothetical protein